MKMAFLLVVWMCVSVAKGGEPFNKYNFSEARALYESGSALPLELLPPAGVMAADSIIQDGPTDAARVILVRDNKGEPRMQAVMNFGLLSNEAQAAHLAACSNVFPPVALRPDLNATIGWSSYSNLRMFYFFNTGGVGYDPAYIIYWRTAKNKTGQQIFVGRCDANDPGFDWGRGRFSEGPYRTIENSYLIAETIQPVVPDTGVKASCKEFLGSYNAQPATVPRSEPQGGGQRVRRGSGGESPNINSSLQKTPRP